MTATTSPAPLPDNLPPTSGQSWSLGVVSGSASGSFVRMFKPRFAALVETGEKLQTVRPAPKRTLKAGDRISLRCWTGAPYRSKQRVLREAVIVGVDHCEITETGVIVNSYAEPCDDFARADGFRDFFELADWFRETHGLPFEGVVIRWQNGRDEP